MKMKVFLLWVFVLGYAGASKLQVTLPPKSLTKLLAITPDCIQKADANFDILLQIREKKHKLDDTFYKFAKCMFKNLQLIDDKGIFSAEKVQEFCGMSNNEELKTIIETCNKKKGKSEQDTLTSIFKCQQNKIDVKYNF